jgi:hypothetical protein
MRTVTTVIQMFVRAAGLAQLVLGVLLWTGTATGLRDLHILLGILLVLALWTLAVLAAVARTAPGIWLLALAWGVLTVWFGLTQERLLTGSAHWVVEVLHLAIGLGVLGQAEGLATRIKGRLAVGPAGAAGTTP